MEPLRMGRNPRVERPFLYTTHNGKLHVPHLLANGIILFCSAKFHDTELRSLKDFARRYGGIVPYHRWNWQDLERAANPKESPGNKMLKGGSGPNCPVAVLYPPGF